jgi:Tol biopolymer transport system component
VVLFALGRSGLYSVPESGGTPVPVTTLNSKEQEVAHRWPQFLPDGEHFLYFVVSAKPDRTGTYLGSLQSKQAERLLDVPAIFAAPGYLVYTRDHLLMAQAFDPARPRVRQAAMVIGETAFPAESIDGNGLSAARVSLSANGLLAYTSSDGMSQLKWFDRSGHELAAIDTPVPVPLVDPLLSPDQKQCLVASGNLAHGVWLVDLSRGVSTRIVADGMRPLWSPDGSQVAFSADRGGLNSFFTKATNGSDKESLRLSTGYTKALNDWSPDGRYILYTRIVPDSKNELWILPLFGDQKPRPYLQGPFNEMQGQISPDGHWVAYSSDESGIWEAYLQSFPEPGGKRILSVEGGMEPHWRKDGKELFYLARDRNLMAVSIDLSSQPKIERPHVLFRAPVPPLSRILSNQFAVSTDGQRFLFGPMESTSKEEQLTVLSSWPSLLSH